jgi:hypothetical protein
MACKFIYPKTKRQCTKVATCTNGCCKTHSGYYNKIQKQQLIGSNSTSTIPNTTLDTIPNTTLDTIPNTTLDTYFTIDNNNFNYIINDNIIYFNGEEIVTYIGYSNHVKTINDHINPKYIKRLEEISKHNETLCLEKNKKIQFTFLNMVYINY